MYKILLSICMSLLCLHSLWAEEPAGEWAGIFSGSEIHLEIIKQPGAWTGTVTLIDDDFRLPATISVQDSLIEFSVSTIEFGHFNFLGILQGNSIHGKVTVADMDGEMAFQKIAEIPGNLLQSYTGFYSTSEGDTLLVFPGAYGGLYFMDFHNLAAGVRYPASDSIFYRPGEPGGEYSIWHFKNGNISQPAADWITSERDTISMKKVADAPYSVEDVFYKNGSLKLAGLLMIPETKKPVPAVVYVHGSGPNNTRQDFYDMYIANALARNGVAVLLTDKRGSGKSEGRWQYSSFEDLASDAIAAAEYLSDRIEIQSGQIGTLGFSQGGWLIPITASGNHVQFVINVSGSGLSLSPTLNYEMEQLCETEGLNQQQTARILKIQALAQQYIESGNWEAYKSPLQSALSEDWPGRSVAAGFPQSRYHWQWDFYRAVGDYDPSVYWRKVHKPSLIVYGAKDTQLPVSPSTERLREIFEETNFEQYTMKVYDDSGHLLENPGPGGYIRQDFLKYLADWIIEQGM